MRILKKIKLNLPTLLILILLSGLSVSCDSKKEGDERLKEKTEIEAKKQAEENRNNAGPIKSAELAKEEEYRVAKSTKMENDLKTRYRFYYALKGTFEGNVVAGTDTYKIRITAIPNKPYVPTNRNRDYDEITEDFESLGLNVQVLLWNPNVDYATVSCQVENVKPDISNGLVNIVSERCKNSYSFLIKEASQDNEIPAATLDDNEVDENILNAEDKNANDLDTVVSDISARILAGELNLVENLEGKIKVSNSPKSFNFTAGRVE